MYRGAMKKILCWAGIGVLQAAMAGMTLVPGAQTHAQDGRPIKSRVAPVYPEIAKRMRVTGVVRLAATVDAGGKVRSVKA